MLTLIVEDFVMSGDAPIAEAVLRRIVEREHQPGDYPVSDFIQHVADRIFNRAQRRVEEGKA